MTSKDTIYRILTQAIEKAVSLGALPEADLPQVKIEYPKEPKFGDYATTFALESARVIKRSPLELGAILKPYIEEADIVATVDIVKPGFINIFLSLDYLCGIVNTILTEKDAYGRQTKTNPQKINIEFVSANPTGPMNIVSARAAAIGDTLANLLEATGDIVEREFYINDYGNQVNLLGRSVLARMEELRGKEVAFPEDGYQGEYIRDIARHILDTNQSELDNYADAELIEYVAMQAVAYNVSGQKQDLEHFNVHFKTWFSERSLHNAGAVMDTLKLLESKGVIYTEEGKKLFRSTDYADDKDRVVVREDGRPTYLLADITYHRNKIDRGYDAIIDIWGPDHHGYIARLSGAMHVMGCAAPRFKVLIAQQVNLIMEGETVKMSKRLGRFSTMRDLVDEIGVDVARYFFLMRSLESHLDFDLALAKKHSSENPVFYLQYAHARICSIFREAHSRGYLTAQTAVVREHLDSPEAMQLMKMLAKYPEEVCDAANSLEPHRICTFLMRLAASFHKFYTEHRVLSEDKAKSYTYLLLMDAVRCVMKNGLRLLGVAAPESM